MSSLPTINKLLAVLTVGIMAILLGAQKLAGWYIDHHYSSIGEGARSSSREELFLYTPTLILALTLLLTLLFRHRLWTVLFFLLLAAQLIFLYWLFQLLQAVGGESVPPDPFLDSLDYLPPSCQVAFVIMYFVYKRYDYEGIS